MKDEHVDDSPWWYRPTHPFSTVGEAVDNYLANLESIMTALSQRDLTDDQVEHYARLLQRAERDVLGRTVA